jgi:hypothetical protein
VLQHRENGTATRVLVLKDEGHYGYSSSNEAINSRFFGLRYTMEGYDGRKDVVWLPNSRDASEEMIAYMQLRHELLARAKEFQEKVRAETEGINAKFKLLRETFSDQIFVQEI